MLYKNSNIKYSSINTQMIYIGFVPNDCAFERVGTTSGLVFVN